MYQVRYRRATGQTWSNFGGLKTRAQAFALAAKIRADKPCWQLDILFLG